MDRAYASPAELADRLAELARGRGGMDAFEVRAEATRSTSTLLEPQGSWTTSRGGRTGVSIRAWREDAAAHASVIDPTEGDLPALVERALRLVAAASRHASRTFPVALSRTARVTASPRIHGEPFEPDGEAKALALVRVAREHALAAAGTGATVRAGWSASERRVVVTNSAGGGADVRHYHAGAFAQVTCQDAGRVGEHVEIESGVYGVDDASAAGVPERIGRRAGEIAREQLRAEAAAPGRYRVLVDNEMAGLLAHESFGHLTEFDLLASGWSVLQHKLGARLADERLSIVDAPLPPGVRREGVPSDSWGQGASSHEVAARAGVHVEVDDEGTRGRAVRILDRGAFAAPMHQRDSARSVDAEPTGNGRAIGARFQPIVRMRNTYFEPGDHTVEEALETLGDGLYLCGGRGGSPYSDGSFMFTSSHGYRVEKGEIVAPIKGPAMVGNILQYLPHVEAITKDLRVFSNTFAGCGKWDQNFIHVSLGGPHILASDVLIGGQGASP